MTAGQEQYLRSWRLRVGSLDVSALDIEFDVKKTLKPEPNTASIKIYNLSAASRSALSGRGSLNVALEAGYQGRNSQIYFGQMRDGVSVKEQPEIVTTIETGDSEKKHRGARISVPVGPSVPIAQAMKLIAKSLGVKDGNLHEVSARLQANGKALYPVPTTYVGSAHQAITDFCRSAGLEWSVQDGALQFVDVGGALGLRPYILDDRSGVVGSPTVDSSGVVSATTTMLPEIRPGQRVIFQTKFVKGIFRLTEVQYTGNTGGGGTPWYTNLTAEKIKATSK